MDCDEVFVFSMRGEFRKGSLVVFFFFMEYFKFVKIVFIWLVCVFFVLCYRL